MLDDLRTLVTTVETLRSVETALDLAEMLRQKALPNVTPAAFVLSIGLNGRGNGEAATGAFTQIIDDIYAVIIVMRSAGDVTGARTQPGLSAVVEAVIDAVIGKGPASAPGVFALRRGRLLSLTAGTAIYQLDFSIQNQLRKLS